MADVICIDNPDSEKLLRGGGGGAECVRGGGGGGCTRQCLYACMHVFCVCKCCVYTLARVWGGGKPLCESLCK